MNVASVLRFAGLTLLVLAVRLSAAAQQRFADAYADAIPALLHEKFSESNESF